MADQAFQFEEMEDSDAVLLVFEGDSNEEAWEVRKQVTDNDDFNFEFKIDVDGSTVLMVVEDEDFEEALEQLENIGFEVTAAEGLEDADEDKPRWNIDWRLAAGAVAAVWLLARKK
jgi:hypothetical protein